MLHINPELFALLYGNDERGQISPSELLSVTFAFHYGAVHKAGVDARYVDRAFTLGLATSEEFHLAAKCAEEANQKQISFDDAIKLFYPQWLKTSEATSSFVPKDTPQQSVIFDDGDDPENYPLTITDYDHQALCEDPKYPNLRNIVSNRLLKASSHFDSDTLQADLAQWNADSEQISSDHKAAFWSVAFVLSDLPIIWKRLKWSGYGLEKITLHDVGLFISCQSFTENQHAMIMVKYIRAFDTETLKPIEEARSSKLFQVVCEWTQRMTSQEEPVGLARRIVYMICLKSLLIETVIQHLIDHFERKQILPGFVSQLHNIVQDQSAQIDFYIALYGYLKQRLSSWHLKVIFDAALDLCQDLVCSDTQQQQKQAPTLSFKQQLLLKANSIKLRLGYQPAEHRDMVTISPFDLL